MKHFNERKNLRRNLLIGVSVIVFLITFINASNIIYIRKSNQTINNEFTSKHFNYKNSLLWGWINFTNPELADNPHYRGDSVIIEGRLFHYFTNVSYSGYNITLIDNGNLMTAYNDVTDTRGRFQIVYDISYSADIYSDHNITVDVTSPGGLIVFLNTLTLDYRAQSYFDVPYPNMPTLIGEEFMIDGYLRYDNGSAITNSLVNYFWYDNMVLVDSNNLFTDDQGYISNISIPEINPDSLSLELNYVSGEIGYSEFFISNPKVFANISCVWDLPATAMESNLYNIAGYLVSRTDNSTQINNRAIIIKYNGIYVETVYSDAAGYFSYTFNLPSGSGLNLIDIELVNSIGKNISTSQTINVEGEPTQPVPQPPFLEFFSIFIPVLSGIILGLIGYGYYYYRKQDKLSRVVNLPLESRILNLKILKDSGRLEESISYLFNGIYMELIKAKFGRIREDNETIRDFAIVSVKDLKLNPTSVYPFIQKIEEIIYAQPYQISDKQFYSTIELFSPVYFQLTGYNFELNF